MKDSIGQEAKIGDLVVYTGYSGGYQQFGIVSKVGPKHITMIELKTYYSIDDYSGNDKTEEQMYTEQTTRKSSSGLFTIVNSILDFVLAQDVSISSYKNKSHSPERVEPMAVAYEFIRKHLKI